MQTITISLQKSPEIADAIADLEPGDEVLLHATIKAKDDQTLTLTVEELSVPEADDEDEEKPEMGNEGSDAAAESSPPGTMAAMDDEQMV